MIRVGIIGSAGYTGGELLRLLLSHPHCNIIFAHSTSNAGKPVASIHHDLLGETAMIFSQDISSDIDVLFLCVGHGDAKKFLAEHSFPATVRIIDLSYDYRLDAPHNGFQYGLPEAYHSALQSGIQRITNPGCFATAIQLALLPLAEKKLLHDDIHCTAITGSTGAGQSLNSAVHFTWRSSNVSVYKAFTHQHIPEVLRTIRDFQPEFNAHLRFVPVRGNFTRGILASVYTAFHGTQDDAFTLYQSYYNDKPFVHLVSEQPDLKYVVNTNKCVLHVEVHEGIISIVSVIDNLLKGAVGQAVQNMNLLFGLPETEGLMSKASAF
jgi:N-acetyl-gamma-glutamyl-phosphate reductase